MTLVRSDKRGDRQGRSPFPTHEGEFKQCPHPRCDHTVPSSMFCCSHHWQRLPQWARNASADIRNSFHRDEISDSQMAELYRELYAAVGFLTEDVPECAHVGANCPTCGTLCVAARGSAGRVLLTCDTGGTAFVVGGSVVPFDPKKKYPKSWQRLSPHVPGGPECGTADPNRIASGDPRRSVPRADGVR